MLIVWQRRRKKGLEQQTLRPCIACAECMTVRPYCKYMSATSTARSRLYEVHLLTLSKRLPAGLGELCPVSWLQQRQDFLLPYIT